MKQLSYLLFYFFALVLSVYNFLADSTLYFYLSSVFSLLTGIVYHSLSKKCYSFSWILVLIQFFIMAWGTVMTNLLAVLLSNVLTSGAPDTIALASSWSILLGPIMLMIGLILFIITIVTKKKIVNSSNSVKAHFNDAGTKN